VGVQVEAMSKVARTFEGVPHRLQFVRSVGGAAWYNDSIATTPARALAAVHAFDEPIILLLGGQDKALPWDLFFEEVLGRVDHIVLFGEVGPRFARLISSLEDQEGVASIELAQGLDEAISIASSLVKTGMVVLLSPGCTSFDEFENYEVRGEHFAALVRAL
jgi:UDP-N-acetylmuramoylalanine--D-glutamate ligase